MGQSLQTAQHSSPGPRPVTTPELLRDSAAAPAPATALQSARVLVVDASPGICQQVGMALNALKMEVEFAENVGEAHAMARARHYQLVIIDVALDDAAGYRFCRELAQDPVTRHIPIVAFTARKSWYSRVKVKLAGCRAYLPKPTRIDEFCRVIQSCIQSSPKDYELSSGLG